MPNKKKRMPKADIELVPEPQFEDAMKKVLSATKQRSDKQLAAFQASNKRRREERRTKR